MHLQFLIGAALGSIMTFRPTYKLREKLLFNEEVNNKIDWKDKHNLRFCQYTDIDRRFLDIPSSVNMRDIGGYVNENNQKIKWHKIYRGEELGHLSEEGRKKFAELEVTHIIDLRNRDYTLRHPDYIPEGVKYTNIPLLGDLLSQSLDLRVPNVVDKLMRNIYYKMVYEHANLFCSVLEILINEPDGVFYIHCTNGKDRTGITIAMIMSLLGVDQKQVVSEFSLSNYHVSEEFALFDSEIVHELGRQTHGLFYGTIGVNPDWLMEVLNLFDHYYSDIGDLVLTNSMLKKEDLEQLRRYYLTD